ncbi:surface lipoprotein assembly modifier [Wenzhouxiangella sediminis]|nr:surface lipoprotein assembly modifier [Wenzhouxiangella sediminis]
MDGSLQPGRCPSAGAGRAGRLSRILRRAVLLGMIAAVSTVAAQEEDADDGRTAEQDESRRESAESVSWPFDVTLAAGLQYDDLVTVDELDQSLDEGDTAAVIDLDVEYEKRFSQGTDLDVGYSLSQKSYFDLSEFDLQIHNVSLGVKQNFEDFDIGVRSYAVHARLDNEGLLNFQHVSPYFTTFLSERTYLRAGYYYRNKDFPDNPDRDGTVHAGDADFYFFLDGTTNYFVVGYAFEREDTEADEFDFDGQRVDVRWSRRFDLYGDRPVRVRLDWRLEQRDYDSVTPSIGVRRDDDRQRWRARFDFPITQSLTGLLTYQHRSHDSNLPSADYDDNRIEAQLEMIF